MNTAEEGGTPPEPKRGRFWVGVTRRPDGSLDYSRAMERKDPEGKLARTFAKARKKARKREKEMRAERLKIPEYIKPGSAAMVRYKIGNAIFLNEEAANKDRKDGKTDKRREALIRELRMEQNILDNFRIRRKEGADLTASQMYDLVQEVINRGEALLDEGQEDMYLFGDKYPIKDLLKVERDLQSRLLDEASKEGEN